MLKKFKLNFTKSNITEEDVIEAIEHEKANFELCLDLYWSSRIFSAYRRIMGDFGLEKLASFSSPCCKTAYESFVKGQEWLGFGRFTAARRTHIIKFQTRILDFIRLKRTELNNIKIRQ
jgi:hypothetical protein